LYKLSLVYLVLYLGWDSYLPENLMNGICGRNEARLLFWVLICMLSKLQSSSEKKITSDPFYRDDLMEFSSPRLMPYIQILRLLYWVAYRSYGMVLLSSEIAHLHPLVLWVWGCTSNSISYYVKDIFLGWLPWGML